MSDRLHIPFVIGMDGGGTKTKACIADLEGKVIDALEGGSMNVNSAGRDGVIQNITALLQAIQKRGFAWDGLRGLCLAAAGVSNPLTREVLEEAVRQAGIGIRPIIIGDHQAALYGAHRGGTGMILIAGTGSVCYGKNEQGQEARSGGFGHLIDDEGSAYALGRDVLSAVVQAEDGRIPPTVMRSTVMQRIGTDSIAGLIQWVYAPSTGKKDIAALAPIVMEGWQAGETAAAAILDRAAEELARLVVPVAGALGMKQGAVALCGSVLLRNEEIRHRVAMKLSDLMPQLQLIAPLCDAATGAVLRCLEEL